jgi:hypothetical protein
LQQRRERVDQVRHPGEVSRFGQGRKTSGGLGIGNQAVHRRAQRDRSSRGQQIADYDVIVVTCSDQQLAHSVPSFNACSDINA